MKHITYILTTIFIISVFSLSACGGNSGSNPSNTEISTTPTKVTEKAVTAGDPEMGKEKFLATCSACHGEDGKGKPGLGKDMTTSEFIAGKTDKELVAFIKVGRNPGDPLNTTGVGMPVKGGNPTLQDNDLYDIVSYIRIIQKLD